jgi:hypothetical protein
MALISELLASVILLMTRAFDIVKMVCLFPIRIGLIVIYTWTELVRNAIIFNVNILLSIMSWTFGIILMPVRAVNAIQRESQVSSHSIVLFMVCASYIIYDVPIIMMVVSVQRGRRYMQKTLPKSV